MGSVLAWRPRPGHWVAVVVAVVVALVGLAGPAAAHARLVTTEPAASAVLTAPPRTIVLRFDEQVEPTLGGIRLYDAQERPIDVGPTHRLAGDQSAVTADVLGDMADGTYVVVWRVTSADSHPVEGAFTFAVGAASTGDTAGLVSGLLQRVPSSGPAGTLLALARYATYAGLAVLIGGAAFLAGGWPAGAVSWPARRLLWFGWAFALLAAGSAFLLQGPYAAARPIGDLLDTHLWRLVAETHFGKAQLLRIVVLLGAVPLLVDVRSCRRTGWRVSGAIVAAVLAVSVALGGHAATGRWSGLGIVTDSVHVLAMAWWVGGVAMLAVVVLAGRPATSAGSAGSGGRSDADPDAEAVPAGSEGGSDADPAPAALSVSAAAAPPVDALTAAVRRFSALALVAVAVVAVSGVVQGLRILDGLGELTSTRYGRLLLWKLAAVAVAVALGGTARWVVRRHWPAARRLRRVVAVELAALALVIGITTALVAAAPGVAGGGGKAFTASLVQGNLIADVAVTPAAVGASELHLIITVPGGALQPVQDATARITLADKGIGPIPVTLVPAGPNHYISTGLQLPYDGDWSLEVLVTPQPGQQVRLETTMPVRG
jgi:copper transport protein